MPRPRDESKTIDICNAAMKLVIQTGFNGLKMAEVAKAAGIATGTLYIYFEDKESLINHTYIETKQEIAKVLFHPDNQGVNFYDSFRKMWFAYIRFCIAEPEKMLFVEQFYNSGYLSDASIQAGESCFMPFYQFLWEVQQQGLVRSGDADVLKAQLMGPMHELVRLGQKMGKDWLEQQLEMAFDMAWASIRK